MKKEVEQAYNYEMAYFELFNRITDIIEELKQIQQDAEDIMISGTNELTYVMQYEHFEEE